MMHHGRGYILCQNLLHIEVRPVYTYSVSLFVANTYRVSLFVANTPQVGAATGSGCWEVEILSIHAPVILLSRWCTVRIS